MTDAFTKFSVVVTTNNQQALTVAKALVKRWFHVYFYKPDLFEVTGKHSDPNAFFVKPLDGKGLVKQVNRWQMFDLGIMERERREGESDQIEEDPEVP